MNKIHLKGLNGLRAIAAFGVLISHVNTGLPNFGLDPFTSVDLAGFGVTMFFSISGFLITFLLLRESEKSGTIQIRKFYIRRILRIWPLYFWYLGLVILTYVLLDIPLKTENLWYYFLFVPNIAMVTDSFISLIDHYWSLGVEEQFYAFWPWLVKFARKLLPVLIVFTVAFLALKVLLRYADFAGHDSAAYNFVFVTRFDCMAIGGIGAWFYHHQTKWFLKVNHNVIVQIIAWAAIVLTAFNYFHIATLIDHEIIAAVTVVLIVNVSGNKKPLIGLDNRVFDFLGRISYGIYVYHPLVILLLGFQVTNIEMPEFGKYVTTYVGVIGITILISWLSYQFIERQFLKIKDRFTVIASSGSKYFK